LRRKSSVSVGEGGEEAAAISPTNRGKNGSVVKRGEDGSSIKEGKGDCGVPFPGRKNRPSDFS